MAASAPGHARQKVWSAHDEPAWSTANDPPKRLRDIGSIAGSSSSSAEARERWRSRKSSWTGSGSNVKPGRNKSSTIRMRRLRERRQRGIACCVMVGVFSVEIEEMARQGLLQPNQVQDRRAVRKAAGKVLDDWFNRS